MFSGDSSRTYTNFCGDIRMLDAGRDITVRSPSMTDSLAGYHVPAAAGKRGT